MKPLGGWRSDLHAAKAREVNDARARMPAPFEWSLARTEMKLVLLSPTKGTGKTESLRRILYRIPTLTWDAEHTRWAAPLDEVNVQQIRFAVSWLPSANVSDGIRRYIHQLEAKATGRSQRMWK